jgi:transcription antitermination factor NusG
MVDCMIFAEPWPASWFVLIVPPQGELTATSWLAREGVTEAWHPVETIYVHMARHPHKLVPRVKPVATGYLFVKLDRRPIWPFMFERSRGKIQDVMRIGERPVALSDADLMQMRQVPERLRDMRQAAEDAKRIKPGDMVTILTGGFAGWQVIADDVQGGVVRFTAPGGLPGKVDVDRVAKP